MRKKQKICAWLIAAGITIILLIWLVLNFSVKCSFLKVKFSDWISIFLVFWATFLITFYFANKKLDYEKHIEAYESIVIKMQQILFDDPAHISSSHPADHKIAGKLQLYNKEILLYFKKLNNKLNLLKKYLGDLKIQDELDFIEKTLSEYQDKVTEDLCDVTIKEGRSYINKQTTLIDNKLDEIRLKLHN